MVNDLSRHGDISSSVPKNPVSGDIKDENPDLRISPRTELWDDTSYSVWEHVYLLESE